MKRVLVSLFVFSVAAAAFPFGQNKIVYDKFNWHIYHSTHFDFYFYDEERGSLQRVTDSAESAYLELSQKFNYQISKKIPLIFYATHSAFEQTNVDLNFISEGVGAFAEPTRNRMVLPVDMSDEKLEQLIRHELTHIFEYEILFQGKLGKTIAANPPTWLMEGLASFMGQDEDSRDRMVLRDAVVNDQIPAITKNPSGYFAYRFGHAVFKYMQETYGWEGLRDFIYEYRNTLGNTIDRAIKRAFDKTPEEFDTAFRTWLRKQYLPALVAEGEPTEYGQPFKIAPDVYSNEISPVPSPSGDLLAAFTTYKEQVDLALFNIPQRKLLKNLTPGYTARYEYPIAQFFTTGPVMGRDIAFSPTGDEVALFVKHERGRNLMIINPLSGKIMKSIELPVEQQLAPTYSPDGTKIAFAATKNNQEDIYTYDLTTGELTNVTNDRYFDGAPVYSPDGKWMVYTSTVDTYSKLFKMSVANPKERYQITSGNWNDADPWFSPDGKRVFFSSDKQTGRNVVEAAKIIESAAAEKGHEVKPPDPTNFAAYNIYSINLENGDLLQYTDVIGGCFTPVVFTGQNNRERMVFASYYKGDWRLYEALTDRPLHAAEKTILPTAPIAADARPMFHPESEFVIDEDKIEKRHGFKLFIDDVSVNAGVTSDQLFVSQSVIYMSDMMGDRRFIAALDSVSSFSNFDFLYFDLQRRTNWGFRVFDNRTFYTAPNFQRSTIERVKNDYRETGAMALLSYPFNRYHRIDVGTGYMSRMIAYPFLNPTDGSVFFQEEHDNFPLITTTFTGDSTAFKFFGPINGRRYEVSATYAPDIKRGGSLSSDFTADWREYKQLTSRTLFAARFFVGYSSGNLPNFYYFGGLNTLRGYDFRSIVGNRAAFANFEFRFPLIDYLITPVLGFQQMRGELFFDIGGANFNGTSLDTGQPFKFMKNGLLVDGKSSVGYGISFTFMGLELHWDFAKRYDLKNVEGRSRTSFWIGETF